MLPDVNALPGAENEFAARDRDAQVDGSQGSADVRGHVVVAFGRVDEHGVSVGHELIEKGLEIAAHVWIGVFLNEKRRGSVLQMERRETRFQTAFRNKFFDAARKLIEAASAGRDLQFVNALTQHDIERRAEDSAPWPGLPKLWYRRRLFLVQHALEFLVARITARNRLLVMPLREFLERRLLGGVGHGE